MLKSSKSAAKPVERCHGCGEPLKRVRITYGYPTPEALERAERGELVLGGCQPGGPKFACSKCREPIMPINESPLAGWDVTRGDS